MAPTAADQPQRQNNIAAIVSYFKSGISPAQGLGIELEHQIVHDDSYKSVSYSEEKGIHSLLKDMLEAYPTPYTDVEGDLLGCSKPGAAITIEPASQLELSTGPFTDLFEAKRCFEEFEQELGNRLARRGQHQVLLGYNPQCKALDLELIPKRRYKFMNRYLSQVSESGPRMMRGSSSTQISIDYHSEQDCLTKFKLACVLTPLFALMMDNSPRFEGAPRPHHMMRTMVWKHCDPDRCNVVQGALEPEFNLEAYAAYILDTPAILVPCPKEQWCYDTRSFGEIYADKAMNRQDVEHAVSMLFNDVRLKTYIEIRPADATPIPYVIAYAALIKGLFYNQENLDALSAKYAWVREKHVALAKDTLMMHGYDAKVYKQPAHKLTHELIQMAKAGLKPEEARLLEPLASLVAKRVTLADLCANQHIKDNGKPDNSNMMATACWRGYFDDGLDFINQTIPVSFPVCEGWMPPEFIDAAASMYLKQTRFVHVCAAQAYEKSVPERIIHVERKSLGFEINTPVGEMLNLEAPDGQTYPARLIEVTDDEYIFDMNHEAICKDLNFKIELLDLESLDQA